MEWTHQPRLHPMWWVSFLLSFQIVHPHWFFGCWVFSYFDFFLQGDSAVHEAHEEGSWQFIASSQEWGRKIVGRGSYDPTVRPFSTRWVFQLVYWQPLLPKGPNLAFIQYKVRRAHAELIKQETCEGGFWICWELQQPCTTVDQCNGCVAVCRPFWSICWCVYQKMIHWCKQSLEMCKRMSASISALKKHSLGKGYAAEAVGPLQRNFLS